MHHGTCATHVPWCMSGSLIRGNGENVSGIPVACANSNFTYLARSPCIQRMSTQESYGHTYCVCCRESKLHELITLLRVALSLIITWWVWFFELYTYNACDYCIALSMINIFMTGKMYKLKFLATGISYSFQTNIINHSGDSNFLIAIVHWSNYLFLWFVMFNFFHEFNHFLLMVFFCTLIPT